ncbi:MAG: flippase [Anaerolineales bacterium]|nr:flippase [Anaerolineales bacterium]
MNSISKILKESSFNFIGTIVGNILGYVWLTIMIRVFSQEDFGSFTLAQSIINISLVFVLLGIHLSLDRYIPFFNATQEYGKIKSLLKNVLIFVTISSIIVCSILYAISPIFGNLIFDNATLVDILPIVILTIPFLALIMVVIFAFGGYKNLRFRVYLRHILEPGLRIGITLLVIIYTLSIIQWTWFYLAAVIITALVGLWVLAVKIFQPLKKYQSIPVNMAEIFSYTWPMSISGVLMILVGQIDFIVLGIYNPASDIGIFRVYIQIIVILKLGLDSMSRIYKPVISEMIIKDDINEVNITYQKSAKWILLSTTLALLMIILFGDQLTALLFTEAYTISITALMILAAGAFLKSIFGLGNMTLEAFGNTKLIFINSLCLIVTNLSLDLILIPDLGLVGAAIAAGTTMVVAGLLGSIEIYYLYKMQPISINTFKILIIGGLTGVLMYFMWNLMPKTNLLLILMIAATAIIFFLGVLASRIMDKDDLEVFSGLKRTR